MYYLINTICSLIITKMSETDATKELQAQIEANVISGEPKYVGDLKGYKIGQPEVESDTDADEEPAVDSDESSDSAQKEVDETSEDEDSDDSEEAKKAEADDSETEEEVEFDFHNTSTSVQKLVNNLKDLSPEDRKDRVSKLTREKEIEAVKSAYPDAFEKAVEEVPVSRKEIDVLTKKFEELSNLAKPEELAKALEIANKLKATEGLTDTKLKDLMLQDQFGDDSKEVAKDTKFITAYDKFPTLTIEERLAYACSLSPVARKLATQDEVKKQVRLKNTKTVSKGKQTTETKKMGVKDVKHINDFEKLVESRLG